MQKGIGPLDSVSCPSGRATKQANIYANMIFLEYPTQSSLKRENVVT